MNKIFALSAALFALSAAAQEQDQPLIPLRLTPQQLQVVGAGLSELPYKVSASVLAELDRQAREWQERQKKAAADEKKDNKK